MNKLILSTRLMPTNKLNIKFTGKSQMIEAKLGELSTLTPIGTGVFAFMNSDPQYVNSASFTTPINCQDGTRVNASNTIGNMLVNSFIVVKRIELIGGFAEVGGDRSTDFVGNPVITGQFYHGGLIVTHSDAITFTPDIFSTPVVDTTEVNNKVSRWYWEGEYPMGAFTSFIISMNSAYDLASNTGVILYFDEVKPMTQYHEYLRTWLGWDNSCNEDKTCISQN